MELNGSINTVYCSFDKKKKEKITPSKKKICVEKVQGLFPKCCPLI
jgi:hypothetical protein